MRLQQLAAALAGTAARTGGEAAPAGALPPPQQLLLGSYLLLDGDLFEPLDAEITAAVQRPTKLSPLAPLITADFPWEGTMHMYGSVVVLGPDDHRIYYACNMQAKVVPRETEPTQSR